MTSPWDTITRTHEQQYTAPDWNSAAAAQLQDQAMRDRMASATIAATADHPPTPEGQVQAQLSVLGREWETAYKWKDPNLKPEAEQARRQDMRNLAAQFAGEQISRIADAAAKEAEAAGKDLNRYLLRAETADVAAASAAWQHSVLPTLEATAPGLLDWDRLIASAGPDDLAGILRFGQAWVRRHAIGDMPEIAEADAQRKWAGVTDAVQRRHIQLHPSDDARNALARAIRTSTAASATGRIAREMQAGRLRTQQDVNLAAIALTANNLFR